MLLFVLSLLGHTIIHPLPQHSLTPSDRLPIEDLEKWFPDFFLDLDTNFPDHFWLFVKGFT